MKILDALGVEGERWTQIVTIAREAGERGWWESTRGMGERQALYANLEAGAAAIREYQQTFIPGLLQTPDYIEALMRSSGKPPAWRRRSAEARLRRQQVLERDKSTAPQLEAVIAEASLMYRWGSRTERRDQLLHLAELGQRPNIRLHLQRFADGPPPWMFSAVHIFDYSGERSLVFTENDHGVQEVTDGEYVNGYIEAFDRAVDVALEPMDTAMYLKQLAERLE